MNTKCPYCAREVPAEKLEQLAHDKFQKDIKRDGFMLASVSAFFLVILVLEYVAELLGLWRP